MPTNLELSDEKRVRVAALLDTAAGTYNTLSRIYYDAAESARLTCDPKALDQLEAMAEKFAGVEA